MTASDRILHGSLYCLTFVTGLIDAASYVGLGHVFTANMTGNIVFLGFAFGGVSGMSIRRSSTALAFALVGGFLAGRLDAWLGKTRRNLWLAAALALETALLCAAMAICWHCVPQGTQSLPVGVDYIIALTALGMGFRNGTIRKLAVPELTTTVLTMTVAAIAFDFSLTPGGNPRWRRRIGSIVMMFAGGYLGVLLVRHSLTALLAVAAGLSGVCALLQVYRQETAHEAGLHS